MRWSSILALSLLAICGPTFLATPEGNGGSSKYISAHTKKIRLKVNVDSERQLQAEVDKGHQPWRLNAVDVAAATLSHFEKQDIATDACVLESTTEQEAIVKYVGRHLYRVRLKRLVKPKGIWTAVEIEVRSLSIPVR